MILFVKRVFSSSKLLYSLSFILFLIAIIQTPFADTDFGWHYRYGEYIVNNRSILYHNIFSFTFVDYMWANSYWISQVIFFMLFKIHPIFISVFLGLLFFLILLMTNRLLKTSAVTLALGSLLLAIHLNQFLASVRPLGFSSIFLLIEVALLLFYRNRLMWLPVLFAVWANFHADFTLGLFVLGVFTLFDFVRFVKKEMPFSTLMLSIGVLLFSAVATFINPYGDYLWQTLLKETHPYQFSHINEWVPARYNPLLSFALYSFVLSLGIYVVFFSTFSVPMWLRVVLVFFILFSIRSIYFSRIVGLLAFFPLVWEFDSLVQRLLQLIGREIMFRILNMILLLSIILLIPVFIEKIALNQYEISWSAYYKYPYKAVSYIKEHKIEGNMFNDYSWGGYLIYALPEKKTYIDGRMASWREGSNASLEEYINLVDHPKEFIALLDIYSVQLVLEKPETRIVTFLSNNRTWEKLYHDKDSVLFKRSKR